MSIRDLLPTDFKKKTTTKMVYLYRHTIREMQREPSELNVTTTKKNTETGTHTYTK